MNGLAKSLAVLDLVALTAGAQQSLLRPGDRIVLCGDSITEQAYFRECGYYHQLTNALAQVYPGQRFEVANLGFSGHTVYSWYGMEEQSRTASGIRCAHWDMQETLSRHADIVTILLGMNDLLYPTVRDNPKTWDDWTAQYAKLIAAVRQRTTPRLIVLGSITPLTADAEGAKNRVRDALNARLRDLAAREHCLFASTGEAIADLIACCREIQQDSQPVPDFVHPSSVGHIALALAFARALGDEGLSSFLSQRYAGAIAERFSRQATLTYWMAPDRINAADDDRLTYRIAYTWTDRPGIALGGTPTVTLRVPEGWTVAISSIVSRSGTFVVRGTPSALKTPLVLTGRAAWFGSATNSASAAAGEDTVTATVDIPTPWRVAGGFDNPKAWTSARGYQPDASVPACEAGLVAGRGFDKPLAVNGGSYLWLLSTSTIDYTGFGNPNSIDPFGLFFGSPNDALYAARWVYSEKARGVIVRVSHATFSATLGLRLWVNGEPVATLDLNRDGKNRAEARAALRAGWNRILVRCDHLEWQRQFACELAPLPGDDLSGLRYSWKQQQ